MTTKTKHLSKKRITETINSDFGGIIAGGSHAENGEGCTLECYSRMLGLGWTDDPVVLGIWDIRGLNDGFTDDAERTKWMIPLLWRYQGSRKEWSRERQQKTIERIVIETVRQIVSELPGLPKDVAKQCREADFLSAAHSAASYARSAASSAARYAARSASSAASYAVMAKACKIWIDAAVEFKDL